MNDERRENVYEGPPADRLAALVEELVTDLQEDSTLPVTVAESDRNWALAGESSGFTWATFWGAAAGVPLATRFTGVVCPAVTVTGVAAAGSTGPALGEDA